MIDDNFEKISINDAQEIMLSILRRTIRVLEENNIEYFLVYGSALGAARHSGFIPWDDDLDIGVMRSDFDKISALYNQFEESDLFLQTLKTDPFYDTYEVPCKIRDNNSLIIERKGKRYHQGIFIDIFPFDFCDDFTKYRKALRISRFLFVCKTPFRFDRFNIKFLIRSFCQLIFKLVPSKFILDYIKYAQRKYKTLSPSKYIVVGNDILSNEIAFFENDDIFPLKDTDFQNISVKVPNHLELYLEKIYGDWQTLPSQKDRISHSEGLYYKKKLDSKMKRAEEIKKEI
ncbi:MAG: LicD family protein [Bacilli bacterium]